MISADGIFHAGILRRQSFHLRTTCCGGQIGGHISRIGSSRKSRRRRAAGGRNWFLISIGECEITGSRLMIFFGPNTCLPTARVRVFFCPFQDRQARRQADGV